MHMFSLIARVPRISDTIMSKRSSLSKGERFRCSTHTTLKRSLLPATLPRLVVATRTMVALTCAAAEGEGMGMRPVGGIGSS